MRAENTPFRDRLVAAFLGSQDRKFMNTVRLEVRIGTRKLVSAFETSASNAVFVLPGQQLRIGDVHDDNVVVPRSQRVREWGG